MEMEKELIKWHRNTAGPATGDDVTALIAVIGSWVGGARVGSGEVRGFLECLTQRRGEVILLWTVLANRIRTGMSLGSRDSKTRSRTTWARNRSVHVGWSSGPLRRCMSVTRPLGGAVANASDQLPLLDRDCFKVASRASAPLVHATFGFKMRINHVKVALKFT